MQNAHFLFLARLAALTAIATSAALFLHYVNPVDGAFCGAESGCENVRRSPVAYFGAPFLNLPLVGLIAFGTVFFTSLRPGEAAAKVFRGLAYVGGLLALGLLLTQAVALGAFCWLCVIVDVAGIAVALFAFLASRAEKGDELLRPGAWIGLAALAIAAPVLWPQVRPAPDVPAGIRAHYVDGKVNVVEFADFQCPFCRKLHPVIKKVIEGRDDVHFVRLNMPLKQHAQARDAARAAICGEALGKKEKMADALFDATRLDAQSNLTLAKKLGLDVELFARCVANPKTDARIDAEAKILRDAGFMGLPTTYIGSTRIVGASDEAVFREALDRAARGEGSGGVPAYAYLAIVIALMAGAAWMGRNREESAAAE